jgi:hypothetical protein
MVGCCDHKYHHQYNTSQSAGISKCVSKMGAQENECTAEGSANGTQSLTPAMLLEERPERKVESSLFWHITPHISYVIVRPQLT